MNATKKAKVLELLQAHGELYGLELVRRSENVLGVGTVYVLLDAMEAAGEIESRPEKVPLVAGPGMIRRRLYRLKGAPEGER